MGWPVGWTDVDAETVAYFGWDREPDIPRVTDKKSNRVPRLKAIGNGQVPVVVAEAWKRLS